MNRTVRLCVGLDKFCSKRDTASNEKKRYRYKRAVRRFTSHIRHLVNEVHRQLAKFLATNYEMIMLPSFLRSKTVRQMLGWAHYRFRQRLLSKRQLYETRVAFVNEAYTSKTCSTLLNTCGTIDYKLGGKKVYSV